MSAKNDEDEKFKTPLTLELRRTAEKFHLYNNLTGECWSVELIQNPLLSSILTFSTKPRQLSRIRDRFREKYDADLVHEAISGLITLKLLIRVEEEASEFKRLNISLAEWQNAAWHEALLYPVSYTHLTLPTILLV